MTRQADKSDKTVELVEDLRQSVIALAAGNSQSSIKGHEKCKCKKSTRLLRINLNELAAKGRLFCPWCKSSLQVMKAPYSDLLFLQCGGSEACEYRHTLSDVPLIGP